MTTLHHVSGFEQVNADGYKQIVQTILSAASFATSSNEQKTILEILEPNAKVMEFGCGGGGFLKTLNELTSHGQLDLHGIDYSSTLIDVAKQRVPDGTFSVGNICERQQDTTTAYFHATFSFGVFFYLNSLDDAYKAIEEMVRITKPGGQIIIAEVSDAAKKQLDTEMRQSSSYYQSKEYSKRSASTPSHLFYPKSFFLDSAEKLGIRIHAIVDECDMAKIVEIFEPAKLRYTVFATKNA